VNNALVEAFRHNSWATKELLAFCRALPSEKLGASATGRTATSLPPLTTSSGRTRGIVSVIRKRVCVGERTG
jgi:hypothetical protein